MSRCEHIHAHTCQEVTLSVYVCERGGTSESELRSRRQHSYADKLCHVWKEHRRKGFPPNKNMAKKIPHRDETHTLTLS